MLTEWYWVLLYIVGVVAMLAAIITLGCIYGSQAKEVLSKHKKKGE